MKKKVLVTTLVACLVAGVSGMMFWLAEVNVKEYPKDCEGNGTCAMKLARSLQEQE